ncbi:hypothetical protein CISIN_1g043525mg [Citrus sinensis]|uniref:Uncharacterized protein n=1 Tax=Citrus sinensis TaxID=2711 RepID=A0A067H5Q7_CITSI|nr:hypothetical protein CISIN_1g043525mg [Citrus sinensis]
MSTTNPNLWTILSESKRIIKAHSRHFLALSVIFLLPISFSVLVFPTLQQLLLLHDDTVAKSFLSHIHTSTSDQRRRRQTLIILSISYAVFALVFSLCAVASITYSVFHGFYGRPVKLVSSLYSILHSFFPLLITTLVCQLLVSALVPFSPPPFIWALVSVIVVSEQQSPTCWAWGVRPFKRSAHLIKGFQSVALSIYLYFAICAGILILSSWGLAAAFGGTDGWKSWAFVLQIVVTSALLTLLFLYLAAANTVLYMCCKATHGELAMEIAEEFAREYVRLPFDDGKVPHLVSVVYTT